MMNLDIFAGDKVRKTAIGSATLIALALFVYFVVGLRTQIDVRTPVNSHFATATVQYPSGLEALFITDPTATQSSAALSISIGSGFEATPGLAHFLEHLIFIASAKYPLHDQFTGFITENGGFANAYTELDETNFYFDVKTTALQRALDMFASLFISPLFPEERVSDEVKAVHSEYLNDLLSEPWRRMRLLQVLSNPDHPFNHFTTGNAETLHRTELKTMVQEFYRKWYKGSLMKLVVMSSHPVSLLKTWTANAFAGLERGPVVKPERPDPFPVKNQLIIAPRQTTGQTFTIYVPFPSQKELRASLPVSFLVYLLGLETEHSLSAELKNLNWIYSLTASYAGDFSDFTLLEVHMELTKSGLRHWRDCLDLYRDYVAAVAGLAREEIKPAWDFFLSALSLRFDYQYEWQGGDSASQVAHNMLSFPKQQYLSGLALPVQFDYPQIREYLKGPMQTGLLGVLMASSFSHDTMQLDQHEYYYGMDYRVEQLPAQQQVVQWVVNLPEKFDVSQPLLVDCAMCSSTPTQVSGSWHLVPLT